MIPSELKKRLEKSAKRRGIPMAELVRKFTKEKLEEEEKGNLDSLRKLVKIAKKGKGKDITSENFRQQYHRLRGL